MADHQDPLPREQTDERNSTEAILVQLLSRHNERLANAFEKSGQDLVAALNDLKTEVRADVRAQSRIVVVVVLVALVLNAALVGLQVTLRNGPFALEAAPALNNVTEDVSADGPSDAESDDTGATGAMFLWPPGPQPLR